MQSVIIKSGVVGAEYNNICTKCDVCLETWSIDVKRSVLVKCRECSAEKDVCFNCIMDGAYDNICTGNYVCSFDPFKSIEKDVAKYNIDSNRFIPHHTFLNMLPKMSYADILKKGIKKEKQFITPSKCPNKKCQFEGNKEFFTPGNNMCNFCTYGSKVRKMALFGASIVARNKDIEYSDNELADDYIATRFIIPPSQISQYASYFSFNFRLAWNVYTVTTTVHDGFVTVEFFDPVVGNTPKRVIHM